MSRYWTSEYFDTAVECALEICALTPLASREPGVPAVEKRHKHARHLWIMVRMMSICG